MADHDEFDRLLDTALSTYADAGPNLAPRVLQQVSLQTTMRRRRAQWLWGAGLATAATATALLLLIAPWRTAQPGVAPRTEASVALPQPHPAAPTETTHATRPIAPHAPRTAPTRAVTASAPSPKQDIFPAPRPLSAEEQALAHLVAQSSRDERHDLLTAQQQADAPIRISAISIPPISSPSEGKE